MEKMLFVCHEYPGFEACHKLVGLKAHRGDACVMNLTATREKGLEAWIASGERL